MTYDTGPSHWQVLLAVLVTAAALLLSLARYINGATHGF